MEETTRLDEHIPLDSPGRTKDDHGSAQLIEEYSHLLESLYSSSLSPHGFQSFLDKMVEEFHLADAVIYFASKSTGQIYSAWMAGSKVSAVLEHMNKNLSAIDYVIEYVQSSPISRFYTLNHDIGRPTGPARSSAVIHGENWFDSHFSDVFVMSDDGTLDGVFNGIWDGVYDWLLQDHNII
ncbi:hypothetical protein MD535_08605 [Vibrio sp. ZSDZ65]|uniref:Uncharacterized protein n=1 Tax=Vibrio qingdaonensis TaxID=2829491 RepID=A0A9X3CMA4_9VIBR|nr:hypothetical protein [Vibrio qingdaonensis]MCW8346067.1 hypothetical protein [Vibrio qingdaonensis]